MDNQNLKKLLELLDSIPIENWKIDGDYIITRRDASLIKIGCFTLDSSFTDMVKIKILENNIEPIIYLVIWESYFPFSIGGKIFKKAINISKKVFKKYDKIENEKQRSILLKLLGY